MCPLTEVINLHITSYIQYPEPLSRWKKKDGKLENLHPHPEVSPCWPPEQWWWLVGKYPPVLLGDVKPLVWFNCQGVSAGKLRRWIVVSTGWWWTPNHCDMGKMLGWNHQKPPSIHPFSPKLVIEFQVLFKPAATCSRFEGWSSWWFQPIWKILVKMGIFPK